MKKKKENKDPRSTFTCPACGSTAFIQEGMANFKDNVTIYETRTGTTIEGGSPELDIISETTKCAQCGQEV